MYRKTERVQKKFSKPSLTKQSFKEECDLNLLVKRFKDNNADVFEQFSKYSAGEYGDFSEIVDYRTALEQVKHANESFSKLPAQIRQFFHNSPEYFLDFCQNSNNIDTLRELGLAHKSPIQSAQLSQDQGVASKDAT